MKSCMKGDFNVQFREHVGVKFPCMAWLFVCSNFNSINMNNYLAVAITRRLYGCSIDRALPYPNAYRLSACLFAQMVPRIGQERCATSPPSLRGAKRQSNLSDCINYRNMNNNITYILLGRRGFFREFCVIGFVELINSECYGHYWRLLVIVTMTAMPWQGDIQFFLFQRIDLQKKRLYHIFLLLSQKAIVLLPNLLLSDI